MASLRSEAKAKERERPVLTTTPVPRQTSAKKMEKRWKKDEKRGKEKKEGGEKEAERNGTWNVERVATPDVDEIAKRKRTGMKE